MTVHPARGDRLRVLLIDRDPVFRASLAVFFHRRRFDVAAVPSGEEALRALSSFAPAFCVIDLFPRGRMKGLEIAEAMHRRDPALQFAFVTARPAPAWAARPAFLRSTPLLRKPVDLEELASVARRVLLPETETRPPPGQGRRLAGRRWGPHSSLCRTAVWGRPGRAQNRGERAARGEAAAPAGVPGSLYRVPLPAADVAARGEGTLAPGRMKRGKEERE